MTRGLPTKVSGTMAGFLLLAYDTNRLLGRINDSYFILVSIRNEKFEQSDKYKSPLKKQAFLIKEFFMRKRWDHVSFEIKDVFG
jgi:hypothetical protein